MSDQVTKRLKMDEGNGSSVQRESTAPKKTCNLSTQRFIDITNTAAFVDKSLFIKAFLEDKNDVIVAVAPRRFGKSTNMDMLKEFLSGNKEVFEKNQLKIWKEERTFFDENCQKNPIIHVDFKSVGGDTKYDIIEAIKARLQEAYGDHYYLVKEVGENWTWSNEKLKKVEFTAKKFVQYWHDPETLSERDVIEGFKLLSQCLYIYYGKSVYVLIDEFDHPIMDAIMATNPGQNSLDEIVNLISDIMRSFLKDNDYVKRGLINACVRISEVLSYDASNIKYYEFLRVHSFVGYYGFTAEEVQDLFEREEFVTFRNDDAIKHWYNGYQVMDTDAAIYNSDSILKYLRKSRSQKKQSFGRYWVDTKNIIKIRALFIRCGIRKLVEELINGEEIEIMTIEKITKENVQTLKALADGNSNVVDIAQAHLFIQFVADNGYLNVIKRNRESSKLTSTVKVQNEEIKGLLKAECRSAEVLVNLYNLDAARIRNLFTDAIYSVLVGPNENAFIRLAKAVSDLFDKGKMPTDEDELYCILFTLLWNIKLFTVRLIENDILVILGCVGMFIELKFINESLEAHEQIETAGYPAVFDEPAYKNVTKKILVSLHIDVNKKVGMTYTVDGKKSITSRE